MTEELVAVLAREGWGTPREIADMDILSFSSAVRCIARVLERDKAAIPAPPPPPQQAPASTHRRAMTKDQKNLDFISKIRVTRG